jgi:hypothetical protein
MREKRTSSSGTGSAEGFNSRKRYAWLRVLALVLPLFPLFITLPAFSAVLGFTTESFAQLETLNIVPSAGATPSVTATATMSIDHSASCLKTTTPPAGATAFSPTFVAANLPLDANGLPAQTTYFDWPTVGGSYLEAAVLNVSCSVESGGVASSYNFALPIYICGTVSASAYPDTAIGFSTSGCDLANLPSSCSISRAGTFDPNAYHLATPTEHLEVYEPSSEGDLHPEQTPAIAVDIQLLYNGFSMGTVIANAPTFSPFLIRVACSSLSAFTNQ